MLSSLKSSREFLDSLPVDYDKIQPKNPGYQVLIKRSKSKLFYTSMLFFCICFEYPIFTKFTKNDRENIVFISKICGMKILLPIFLPISWTCVAFLDELVPIKRLTTGTSARSTRWHMNRHIFDISFWSFGFFGLGKADSGSFS